MLLPAEGATIAAIATACGVGGIGIIRISGDLVITIAKEIVKNFKPIPNQAVYRSFLAADHTVIDSGIAIFFKAPNSFTGEDLLELQAHGGPVILKILLERVLSLGARIAEPGEFSRRAFLAKKLDLVQVESIAALIQAQTKEAAMAASKSLQGEFSQRLNKLLDLLIKIRATLEAFLDFPEEDLDPTMLANIAKELLELITQTSQLVAQTEQSELLEQGINAIILGKPNVGKSSLLNWLAGQELAIVTDLPGTTRDLIATNINLDGLIVKFIDTAGIRATYDLVESLGVKKAIEALATADLVLLMVEIGEIQSEQNIDLQAFLPAELELQAVTERKVLLLVNKIDLKGMEPKIFQQADLKGVFLSTKERAGLSLLKTAIKNTVNFNIENTSFLAKARHIRALKAMLAELKISYTLADPKLANWDLCAQALRTAQDFLATILGEFTNEDLLDQVFANFCIGK